VAPFKLTDAVLVCPA
jgi:hypothetical protein